MTGLCIHVVPNGIKVDNYICGVGEEMQERNANWVVCSGIFCNATLYALHMPTISVARRRLMKTNAMLALLALVQEA